MQKYSCRAPESKYGPGNVQNLSSLSFPDLNLQTERFRMQNKWVCRPELHKGNEEITKIKLSLRRTFISYMLTAKTVWRSVHCVHFFTQRLVLNNSFVSKCFAFFDQQTKKDIQFKVIYIHKRSSILSHHLNRNVFGISDWRMTHTIHNKYTMNTTTHTSMNILNKSSIHS